MHLHDVMWSLAVTEISWPSKKPREHKRLPRIHNHHVSLRDRIEEHGKQSKAEMRGGHPKTTTTTKAVAWAVFEHHGGGGVGHGHSHGAMAVNRRPTRFKIEAQMKREMAHRSFMSEVVATGWNAGSTLFDSFELDSLLKTLEQAAHPAEISHRDGDEADAVVVHSRREPHNDLLHKHDHGEDDDDSVANVVGHGHTTRKIRIPRRSFDSSAHEKPTAKGASHHHHHHHHHHKMWKILLHSLHLDGANGLFHGLHKFQSQVAPHDSEKKPEHKGGSHRSNIQEDRQCHPHIDVEQFDAPFDRREERQFSKDAHPIAAEKDEHHHHSRRHHHWKFNFKAVLTQPFHGHKGHEEPATEESPRKGHEQHHDHQQADWLSFAAKLHRHGHPRDDSEGREHRHSQHHHHREGEDLAMTVQAMSRRVARTSFEEKLACRVSIDLLDGGLEAPRNSLGMDGERAPA